MELQETESVDFRAIREMQSSTFWSSQEKKMEKQIFHELLIKLTNGLSAENLGEEGFDRGFGGWNF